MIILSSPEDDPRERRPGGGEQAPVRAPVRARAPCATPPAPGGAPYPSETPGFWDHAQARARPLGPRRRQNSGSRTGWGRGAGGPSLSVQKLCTVLPPLGRGRTAVRTRSARGAHGVRAGRAHGARTACVLTPECARSANGARAECARSACALRSACGARTNIPGIILRSPEDDPWELRPGGGELPAGAPSSRGRCPRELLPPVGAAHGSSCIPSELLTGAPASRRSCSRELLHPVGAAPSGGYIPCDHQDSQRIILRSPGDDHPQES